MTYAVKEGFLTLQGEGVQAGSRAVFLRFAGCNLWSGREQDRATAQCNFCDTDFVGTDGEGGGKFADAGRARRRTSSACGARSGSGGWSWSPAASRCCSSIRRWSTRSTARGFEIAVETNGTLPAARGHRLALRQPQGRHRGRPAIGRRAQTGVAAGRDRSGRARRMGLRSFPGPADGLRERASGGRCGDRAGDGAAEMAPVAAGAQGGRAALSLLALLVVASAAVRCSRPRRRGRRLAEGGLGWRRGLRPLLSSIGRGCAIGIEFVNELTSAAMLASSPVTASIAVTSLDTIFSAVRFSSTFGVLSAWSLLPQAARAKRRGGDEDQGAHSRLRASGPKKEAAGKYRQPLKTPTPP